jgi:CMP-N-acetylneuraminic acid synthetase
MGKIVAFIPVRGGSKSIPSKNIKLFCGKPLVYWTVSALQRTGSVDEIIVATDSDEIESTVAGFCFSKVRIFRRSPENASDTASTESVMLEYLNQADLNEDDVFLLVQATSPLTKTEHFEEALSVFSSGKYDSMLSCVRIKRFLWNADGTSKNYDYRKRPRRQNFEGELMENGAFYISTVRQVLLSQNRLNGRIGIYEMPEYTAMEIDEPHDWLMMEQLMMVHQTSCAGF